MSSLYSLSLNLRLTFIFDRLPPQHMLDNGKQASQFFDCYVDSYGQKKTRLKSLEQYSRERSTQEQVGKQYFSHKTLPDIIRNAPLASSRHASSARHGQELERGRHCCFIFSIYLPTRRTFWQRRITEQHLSTSVKGF